MYRVMLFPHDIDTRDLRQALWAHRIGHRFTEEAEGQVLWLADPDQHEAMMQLLTRWQRGERVMPERRRQPAGGASLAVPFRQAPVCATTLALCLLVFALMAIMGDIVVAMLTIVPIGIVNGSLAFGSLGDALTSGQVWRLLSPAFLHFGWMHLIFNMLWLWYFGRQVEAFHGSRRMLMILLVAGIGANLAQYATGTVLFGACPASTTRCSAMCG